MLDLFYFNVCFPLLLVTKRMLFIHNVRWETLPLCLSIKPKCLFIRPCPPVDDYRKEEINTFLLQVLPFPEISARLMDFLLWFFISSTTLFYKKPGIQAQIRWLFWGVSLPSPSADFLNKVVFLASNFISNSLACHSVSSASLDLVTNLPHGSSSAFWLPFFVFVI